MLIYWLFFINRRKKIDTQDKPMDSGHTPKVVYIRSHRVSLHRRLEIQIGMDCTTQDMKMILSAPVPMLATCRRIHIIQVTTLAAGKGMGTQANKNSQDFPTKTCRTTSHLFKRRTTQQVRRQEKQRKLWKCLPLFANKVDGAGLMGCYLVDALHMD